MRACVAARRGRGNQFTGKPRRGGSFSVTFAFRQSGESDLDYPDHRRLELRSAFVKADEMFDKFGG